MQAHDTAVRSMIWSHNDQWMLTGDHGGFVKYWQSNMNNVKMYQAHKDPVRGLRWELRHTHPTSARLFVVDPTTYDDGESLTVKCTGLSLVWQLRPSRCTVCLQLKLLFKIISLLHSIVLHCWSRLCNVSSLHTVTRTYCFDGLHYCYTVHVYQINIYLYCISIKEQCQLSSNKIIPWLQLPGYVIHLLMQSVHVFGSKSM